MPDNELDARIESTTDSLLQQKCVLVLGPDIYIKEIGNQVWEKREYFKKLEKEVSECTFFPNDEVFSSPNRYTLQQRVKTFYTGGGDVQLLESISAIRFPLIINASPDESLRKYLQNMDKNVQFEYFEGDVDEKKSIEFDLNKPLIYNLFGKASDPQSLIITHDILYRKMQQILPVNSFPKSIKDFLNRSSSFLFLGFKFDSWSYQLLSYKIINQESVGQDKIRLSSSRYQKKNRSNVIMTGALGMYFTNLPPLQLINNLINLIKRDNQTNFLRNIGKQDKFSSFISYSRKTLTFINKLVSDFAEKVKETNENDKASTELKLLYDKEDLYYGQSIDSFMTRIGRGKTVILVVGDYYLKSEYCMIEALRTNIYHKKDERMFIVLITNELQLDLKNMESGIKYYENYWEDALATLTSKGNKPDKNKVVNYLTIRDFIPRFIKRIGSQNNLIVNTDQIAEAELDKFITQLIDKMKEE